MEYKIHKETGVADSKETILQLIDGKQLCQFKEPYQEVKVYVDMILNHISTFWDDVNDEKVLQKRIIDDEKRVLMIDPEDYTPEDRAFLTKCGGELKFEYDWDGLPEVTYNGSWPEKYGSSQE